MVAQARDSRDILLVLCYDTRDCWNTTHRNLDSIDKDKAAVRSTTQYQGGCFAHGCHTLRTQRDNSSQPKPGTQDLQARQGSRRGFLLAVSPVVTCRGCHQSLFYRHRNNSCYYANNSTTHLSLFLSPP